MKTSISSNIHRTHVADVCIISAIFAVFACISHFPLPNPPALISSIRDYCNSHLYNTANKDRATLQHVHNVLARVVKHSTRFFSFSAASEIIAISPCALSQYFQEFYNNLSSPLMNTTCIFEFSARSSKTFQTATTNQ